MQNPDQIAVWSILVKVVEFLLAQLGEWLKERRVQRKRNRKPKPRRRR